jgi:phosphinothricin tripeptide acetyl hydrolase
MAGDDIARVRVHLASLPDADTLTLDESRALYDRAEEVFTTPDDVAREILNVNGVPAERLAPPGARTEAVLLYLHGGGYVLGSPASHRHMVAEIAGHAGVTALVPDYRLAPEHPHPAAVEDGLAAFRWLLGHAIIPERIVVAGDSAGGGLTVAVLVAAREAGLPMPSAAICVSPWTDLAATGASYETKAESDPLVKRDRLLWMAESYLGGAPPETPLAAPLHAQLEGLPELLIHVGAEEVLLDDSTRLAARAEAAGVPVTLEVWEEMIHVWHWFAPMLKEGREANAKLGAFIAARTA